MGEGSDGAHYTSFLVAPSISPDSGTNPSFRLLVANRTTHVVLDYLQYTAELVALDSSQLDWQLEYDFDQAYNQSNVSTGALIALLRNMRAHPALYAEYEMRIESVYSADKYIWFCATAHINRVDFMNCVANAPNVRSPKLTPPSAMPPPSSLTSTKCTDLCCECQAVFDYSMVSTSHFLAHPLHALTN